MCGCTHTVVRITAAVYEALRPILNEMSQRIEQFDMTLSALDELLRSDFSGVERELNSTATMIYEPTSMGHQRPSLHIIVVDKLQLTVPMSVVWL